MPRARSLSRAVLAVLLAACAFPVFAKDDSADRRGLIHALNRLSYGPRPGDLDRLKAEGLAKHVERQLHPERIDDSACASELSRYPALAMSSAQLESRYPKGKDGAGAGRPAEILEQLAAAKVTRAARCERQLEEIMTDFWFNHFNVAFNKGPVKWQLVGYERDTIRPRVFGRFRELLGAVARSPAMLFYLDNAQSSVDARYAPAEDLERMEKRRKRRPQAKKTGLNENYARELLELHTLGVDGGYTQQDVTELARILTGWSVDRRSGAEPAFVFRPRMHDRGRKTLLGRSFQDDGVNEGERALDLLATHPSTARFIALKLCRRFVADEPPPALVERVAKRFTSSGGDIRDSLRVIFDSPEFADPLLFRAKVRTPLEFVAAALRVTGASLENPKAVARALRSMGQPLYECEPPTGYPDRAEAWVSAGGLLARLRIAERMFATGPKAPARVDLERLSGGSDDAASTLAALTASLLQGEITDRTRSALLARIDHPDVSRRGPDGRPRPRPARLAALILGSPEFQRR